jgi:hypothetical protein
VSIAALGGMSASLVQVVEMSGCRDVGFVEMSGCRDAETRWAISQMPLTALRVQPALIGQIGHGGTGRRDQEGPRDHAKVLTTTLTCSPTF